MLHRRNALKVADFPAFSILGQIQQTTICGLYWTKHIGFAGIFCPKMQMRTGRFKMSWGCSVRAKEGRRLAKPSSYTKTWHSCPSSKLLSRYFNYVDLIRKLREMCSASQWASCMTERPQKYICKSGTFEPWARPLVLAIIPKSWLDARFTNWRVWFNSCALPDQTNKSIADYGRQTFSLLYPVYCQDVYAWSTRAGICSNIALPKLPTHLKCKFTSRVWVPLTLWKNLILTALHRMG